MGELFATLTAVAWALAVIMFKKSGETVPPFTLNLFRVGVSSVLFVITLIVMDVPFVSGAPPGDYLILFASGIIAIAISDTLFLVSLNILGAGITAIVDCLYSPFMVLFAFLLLRERIGVFQYAGMALIIGGVVVASRIEPPEGTTKRRLMTGIIFALMAMVTVTFGIVIAKPVLMRSTILWATAMRQFGCFAVMFPIALVSRRRRDIFAVFRPARSWKFVMPGTLLGSYLSLIFWITGMKYTKAGTAAILNQASTIFILIFATLFLREPFTKRKGIAAAMCVAGIMTVVLG